MGIFAKTKEAEAENTIPIYTVESGQGYELIGLVSFESTKFGVAGMDTVKQQIKKQAADLGADVIIGFRISAVSSSNGNFTTMIGYGTAARLNA